MGVSSPAKAKHRRARTAVRGAAARAESSPAPSTRAAARPKWNRYWYLPVFAIYLTIVVVTVAEHEPWLDEAQAWLIARDAAWPDLLGAIPRYEGSPILWHLVLALPARCGLPYASLGVLAAAFAGGGVLLFLARSPLPKFLAAIVPFTFFLIYQNAVVARSYALMPLLLFAAAAAHSGRHRRPMLYVAPLGLLTHVSAHGWLIGASLVGLLSLEILYRGWRGREQLPLRRAALAVGLFGLVALGAAWQMRPVEDHVRALGYECPLWPRIQFAIERLSGAFTDAYVPSLVVLIASLAWFWHTRALAVYVLPTAAILALFVTANCWYHHEQVLFLIWLFALWISFRRARELAGRESPRAVWFRRCWVGLLAAVFAVQTYWAWVSVREDLRGEYSGAKALAEYLKHEGLDSRRIACSDVYAAAALPYFDRNIFVNLQNGRGSSFIIWSEKYVQVRNLWTPTPYREPFDVLVVGVKQSPFCLLPWQDPAFQLPLSSEYRCVGYFPGSQFWKTGAYERDDFVCYVRKSIPAARHDPGASVAQRCALRVRNVETLATVNDPEKALDSPTKALAAGHSAFGMMLRLLDRRTAVEHFRAAVNLWPTRAIGHANLGAILERTDPQEAARHLRTALELDPQNVAAHINLGNILARSGKLDAAITCYRNALAIEPDFVEARHNLRLAMALWQQRRLPSRSGDGRGTSP
jgi:tetratricopeptide (TPR) repeat protein